MLQNANPLSKLAPWTPTCLMQMSPVLRLPHEMHLFWSCSNIPRLPSFWKRLQTRHIWLTFVKVQDPLCLPRKTTIQLESTSKIDPKVACFTFWLGHTLFATATCTLQHLNFQKALQRACALDILTLKCALHHSRARFLDSSGMCFAPKPRAILISHHHYMAPFSEPTEALEPWRKNSVLGLFMTVLPFRSLRLLLHLSICRKFHFRIFDHFCPIFFYVYFLQIFLTTQAWQPLQACDPGRMKAPFWEVDHRSSWR